MEISTLFKSAIIGAIFLVSEAATAKECSEVVWQQQVLNKYPNIADYCQEVKVIDGKDYVELKAKFVSVRGDKAHLKFQRKDGSYGDTFVTGELPDNFRVNLEGRDTALSRIPRDSELDIFMPADRLAVMPDPYQEYQYTDLAMASYDDSMLPATASHLPLMGLLGALACGFGLLMSTLRLRRKRA